MARVPVVTISSIDGVLRDSAAAGLLWDLPGAVVLTHELRVEQGTLRRVVSDVTGIIEDVTLELDHACMSCAVREDLVPTLIRLAQLRPEAILVALPVTGDPMPAMYAVDNEVPRARLAASLTVLDGDAMEEDLFGDDLLADRHLELAPADRRSVGEALARQVECADVIASAAQLPERSRALLDHLVGDGPVRDLVHVLRGKTLVGQRRGRNNLRRGDLRTVAATGALPECGVWTLDLSSWKPLHPTRLLDQIERLGDGPLRGRGYFWLPSRREVMCAWDGAGGQLSVGELGAWGKTKARTRLVITGTTRDPAEIERAFAKALMTDAELARGLETWNDRDDGWDFWLGPRDGGPEWMGEIS